jgi:autotransporter-associated beta strand protein
MNGGTVIGVINTFSLNDAAGSARNIFLGVNGGGFAAEGGGLISTVGQVPTTLTVGGVITGAAGTGPLIIGIPADAANGSVLGLVPGTGPSTANPAYYALGTVILNNTGNVYTGGTVLDSGTLQLTSANLNVLGAGGVTLNGGSFQWGSSNTTDLSARTITLASGGYFDTNGNNVTFANSIGNSGTGGFTKFGTGALTMNGANTYTGPVTVANGNLTFGGANVYTGATTISSGTLTLASGGSLGATAVSVANGATLQANQSNSGIGSGSSLTLNNGSTLSLVDNAIGTLTTAGTFTLSGTSSLDFDMNQTTADSITVTGGAVLGSGVGTIYLNTITGSTAPASPMTYTLFTDSAGFGSATFALGNASTIIAGTSYVFTLSNTGSAEQITLTAGSLNYYWTGGTSSSWNALANFAQDHTGAQQQTVALNAVDNIFLTADSAANFSQTLDGNYTINSLNFTGTNTGTTTAAATNPVTVASGTGTVLTLGGNNTYLDTAGNIYTGKGLVVQAGAAADTVTANINLGHSQTWEIDNSSTNALLVSGTISDGSTLDSLTKIGVGELILSATNLYDGGTIVSGGTLMLGATNALLTTAPLTVQGTGTFDLAGNNQTVSSLSGGGVSTGVITTSTGASTFTVNNTTANTFGGTVSGSTSIVMTGTSSLTLSGSNSYAGSTTVSAGTLIAPNSYSLSSGTLNGLTLNPASGTATVDLTGSTSSVASLSSSGAGISTVVLGNITGSGSATTLTVGSAGATTIFGGNISDGTTGVGSKATAIGSLVLTGGQITLNGTGTYTGPTTLTGGTLVIGNFVAIEDSTLVYNNGGGTLSFGAATAATFGGLSGNQNLALTNTNATPGAVALTIGNNNESSTTTGNLGGLGSLFKVGSGTFQSGSGTSGGATYAGPTLVNQGTLILGGTTTLTSNIDVGAVGGTSALTIQDNASVNSPGVLEIASDDSSANGSEQNGNPGVSTLLITGTAQVTATGLSIGNVDGATPSRVPTGDAITISGLANVTINGVDTLDNTEGSTGSVTTETLSGGTLGVDSIALGFANGTTQTSTLHLNGGTLKALANDPSGTVFFLPATTGLTVDVDSGGAFVNTNGYNISIAAALVPGTAGGGLTVSGGGSLALLGSDTYTGATTINAGATLQFGNNTTGHDGTLTASSGIADAGSLIFDRFGSVTSGIAISGTGTVTVTGTGGTEILTAVNGYTGPTTINSGATLQLGNGTSSHDGTIESTLSLTDNGTLAFDRSGSLSSAVAITGTGNVTVSGTGSQTLIAVNTYSGATTVNTGATLQLGDGTTGHDGNITASSGIANAGALIFDRFGSVSSGVAISGTGTVTVSGTGGTEILIAVNGYTGPTTINSGATLQLGDGTSGDDGTIESTSSLTDKGTLAFDRSGSLSSALVIGGTGSVTVSGTGSQTLIAASTYSGPTTINTGATLQLGDGTTGHDGTIASTTGILDNGLLIYNRSGSLSSGVAISGTGNVTVSGTGSQTLIATNTYSGATTINSGATLQLGDGTSGHDGTILDTTGILDSGTLIYDRSGSLSSGIAISGGGNVVVSGTGSQTLTGVNTYNGSTTIGASSKLALGSGGSLGNTAVTVNGTLLAQQGNGGIAGTVSLNNGSTLTQQDGAIGSLTLSGLSIAPSANANLNYDLYGSTADTISVTGGALGGSGNGVINFDYLGGGTPADTQEYTVLSDASGFGSDTFSLGTNIITIGGQGFTVSLANSTSTAEILTFNDITQNYYWTGSTSASWSALANFATNHLGAVQQSFNLSNTSNVFLTADSASNYSQTLDGSYTINSLSLTGTSAVAPGNTTGAASNPIALTAGAGGTLTIDASTSFTDADGVSYSVGLEVQPGSAGGSIGANIDLGNTQTWEIDGNSLLVSGTIANGSGGDGLIKSGTGTLILSAANTYSGGTTVSAGTLALQSGGSIGSAGTLNVTGGAFDLAGNPQTLGGLTGSSPGVITSSVGAGTLTVNDNSPAAFGGAITDNNGANGSSLALVFQGSSSETLSGSNSYTGSTTVTSGTLIGSNNYSLGSSTSATGGLVLNPSSGTAEVDFTSATPSIAALASSGAGASSVVLGNAGGGGSATTLTIGGGGQTTVFGGVISDLSGTAPAAIGNVTIAGGALTLTNVNTYTGWTTINTGATLQLGNGASGNDGTILDSAGIVDNGLLIYDRSGSLSSGVAISGTGNVTISGTGSQTLIAVNTYSGATTINTGATLQLGNGSIDGAINSSSGVLDNGLLIFDPASSLSFALAISGTGNVTIADPGSETLTTASTYSGATTINAGAVLQLGDGTSGHDGTIEDSSGIADSGLLIFDRSGSLSSAVAISGTGAVTISGTGSQTLTAVNPYTGPTTINTGATLQLGDGTSGHDGTITSSSGILNNGVLVYNRSGNLSSGVVITGTGDVTVSGTGSQTFTAANTYTGYTDIHSGATLKLGNGTGGNDGSVADSAGVMADGSLIFDESGANSSGVVISGMGTLTVEGAGPVTLTSHNTYQGTTTIDLNATLQLGDGTSGDDGTIDGSSGITDNGTLIFDRFGSASSAVPITGSGDVVVAGGTQILTAVNGYNGATTIDMGATLQLGDGTSGNDGAIENTSSLTDDGTLAFNRSGNVSSAVPISGSGDVTVSGTGSQILIATNTYNGATTVNSGATLQLGNGTSGQDGTIDNSSGVTDNGTLIFNRAGNLSSAVAISGTGNVTISGAGSQTLSANNSYTGATTVSAGGTLIVSGSLSGTTSVSDAGKLQVNGLVNNSATVDVTAGGKLSGTGSVGDVEVTDGRLAPGFSTGSTTVGTLTASGDVSLASDSVFSIRVGLTDGSASDVDQLSVGGTFSLSDGTTTLKTIDGAAENNVALQNNVYVIVNGGAGMGTGIGTGGDGFANAPASGDTFTDAQGYEYAVIYATDAGGAGYGTGNDIAIELVSIPEPGTWATLLCGIGMLLVWRRSRRRTA